MYLYNKILGVALMMTVIALSLAPAPASGANPFVTFSAFTGRPGSTIRVTGGNFSPGEQISVSSNDPTFSASATAGSNGNFGPVTITIPMTARQGPLEIAALGSVSKTRASNSFYVQPFTPLIQVTAPANTPGAIIVITGSGFAPGETVAATLDPAGNFGRADARGNFATSFTLPFKAPDTYIIQAIGQNSGAAAVSHFYLGGFFPSAIPSNYFLTPGQTLTFTGWNFAPNENVTVTSGSGEMGKIAADRTGAFQNRLPQVMAAGSQGTTSAYTLTGDLSQKPISLEVSIGSLTPQVFPSAYFMPPGKDISFSGFGFAPNETVAVFEGENSETINRIRTDSVGSFKNAYGFFMPFDFAGTTRQVRLTGEQSRTETALEISIGTYHPQLAPSAYFIQSGQNLKIDGWNFSPGETVNINAGGQLFSQTANRTGNILINDYTVPFNTDSVTITAVGESTKALATATLTVGNYNPVVSASNYYVLPGQGLTFNGNGFAPGETVTISERTSSGQIQNTGAVKTDTEGNFKGLARTIPFGSTGSEKFSFIGQSSNAEATVDLSVGTFNPYLNADKYSVFPGANIKVAGAGLGGSEEVSVSLNGKEVARTTTNARGETTQIPLTIPVNSAPGPTIISFTGTQSGARASLSLSVQPFNPSTSPSAYFTLPGSSITFSGAGFAPGERIAVSLAGQPVATATANTQGRVATAPVQIPFSASNSVTFEVIGEVSKQPSSITISLGNYQPGLLLSIYYAPAGTRLQITGSGFAPGEKVDLAFGGTNLPAATANEKGGFAVATSVPPVTPGNINLSAKGQASGASVTTNFTVAQR